MLHCGPRVAFSPDAEWAYFIVHLSIAHICVPPLSLQSQSHSCSDLDLQDHACPMPVRQSWVESVLASGGYGSSSFQLHPILLAARWAMGATSIRSLRYSSVRDSCKVQYSMHLCTRYAKHYVARVLSRDSLRRYTSVHLRRPRCCRDW